MNVTVTKKIENEHYMDCFRLFRMRLFAKNVGVVEIPPNLVLKL